MLRTLIGLCILGLFIFPAVAQDKKKPVVDVDKDDAKAVTESKKKLVTGGKIAGKLTHVEAATKLLTLEVKVAVLNESALRTYNRRMAEASRDRNPIVRQLRIAEIQQTYALNQYKEQSARFEFQAADDVKIRTQQLPVEIDDKGKPRKYTAEELSKFKGKDPKLTGYTAEYGDLKAGQYVEITFVKPRPAAAKPKAKDKDRDLVAEDERLKATVIVIHRDGPVK